VLVGRSPFVLDSGFAWFRSVGSVEAHAVVGAHRCQLPGARQVETALFLANSSNVAVGLRSVKLVLELNLASSSDAIRIVGGKWELEPEAIFCRDESWSGPDKTDLRAHVAVRASSAAGAARAGKDGFGAAGKSTSLRMSLTLPLNLPLESFRFADMANVVSAEYQLTFTLETTALFGKRFKVEIPLRICLNGDGPPPAGSDSSVVAPSPGVDGAAASLPGGAPGAFRPEAGPRDSKASAPAPATLPTPSAPPAPPAASAPRREEQVPYATVVEEADEGLGAAVATATAVPVKALAHT
jgi:hypothetical protein